MMIVSDSNEVLLTMNISGREFAKAKLMQYLNDPGYIVSWVADGSCIFKTWCFTGTREDEDTLYMTGPAFEGETLYTILTDSKFREKRFEVFEKLRSAVEQSIEQNIQLPLSGPIGTVVSPDGSILFLPQEYIQRSVSFLEDSEASMVYSCYSHPGLNHTDSLRFMLSVYAYEIITNRLPFPKKNSEERIEDYVDHNFIPAKYWNPGLSSDFSDLICANLSTAVSIKKKSKKNKISIYEQQNEIKSKPLPSIDRYINESDTLNYAQNEKLAAEERVKYISSLTTRIKIKRFFRKKGTLVKVAAAAIAVILISSISLIKENSDKPTTIGLTPYEVIESFYTSLNLLDVTLASSTTNNSVDNSYKNMISSFYVINKMRTAYDSSSQTLHPAQWLYNNRNFADWMYGITNLTINNSPANPFSKHHEADFKRSPLDEEKGTVKNFKVTYFLVRHEGKEELVVTECNEIVELEFTKNRWLINGITSSNTEEIIDGQSFNNEFAGIDSSLDVYEKAQKLAVLYKWIPTNDEIQKAIEELKARYEQYLF